MPAGLVFSIMVMVVAVLALSSGNNLLYILVSLLVATMFFSLFASRMILSRVDVRLCYPERVTAGEEAEFDLTVVNRRRFLPVVSLMVTLIEQPPGSWRRMRFDHGYLPLLPRRTEALVARKRRFARRGVWRMSAIRLESRFPFGLFEHRRLMAVEGAMRVHPPVRSLLSLGDGRLNAPGQEGGSLRRGSGGDLYAIRDSPGTDPHHHIDWKATARTGHLKVREITNEDDERVTILFDYSENGSLERLREAGVLLVASLADRLIRDGAVVRLVTRTRSVPFGSGPEQARIIFDLLADLPFPRGAESGMEWRERWSDWWRAFSDRSRPEIPVEEVVNEDWRQVSGDKGRVVMVVSTADRVGDFDPDNRITLVRCDQLPADFVDGTGNGRGAEAG